MKHWIRSLLVGIASFALMIQAVGCAARSDGESGKLRDLEYTVLGGQEIPQELRDEIEVNKNSPFKYTYSDGEYLYIANGYGEQESGGYSIQMKELYLTEEAIYFASELSGPREGESVEHAASCPYIVVKTEDVGLPVVFQ